VKLSH